VLARYKAVKAGRRVKGKDPRSARLVDPNIGTSRTEGTTGSARSGREPYRPCARRSPAWMSCRMTFLHGDTSRRAATKCHSRSCSFDVRGASFALTRPNRSRRRATTPVQPVWWLPEAGPVVA